MNNSENVESAPPAEVTLEVKPAEEILPKEETIAEAEAEIEKDLDEGNNVVIEGLTRFERLGESVKGLSSEMINILKSEYAEKMDALHEKIHHLMDATSERIDDVVDSVFGDVFRPKAELRRISRAPKGERREMLALFKANLKEHLDGMSRLQTAIIEQIRENPEMSGEELKQKIEGEADELHMSHREKITARKLADAYIEKRTNIKTALEKYPSAEELFRALAKSEPKGNIEIVVHPVSVYLKCENPDDFAELYKNINLSEGEEPSGLQKAFAEVARVGLTLGASVRETTEPLLNGAIIMENSSVIGDRSILEHEEQHSIYDLFHTVLSKDSGEVKPPDMWSARNDHEREKIFRAYSREMRRDADETAKNEFLAYTKEGFDGEEVVGKLTNGSSYDFLWHLRNSRFEIWRAEPLSKEKAKELMKEVYETEYVSTLNDAGSAIDRLKNAGYTIDKIIAVLTYEPITRWKKTAEHLLSE